MASWLFYPASICEYNASFGVIVGSKMNRDHSFILDTVMRMRMALE